MIFNMILLRGWIGVSSLMRRPTILVPVTVKNFTDIATYQGTISFDPAVLTYQSAANHLPAIANIFGAPGQGSVPADAITFSWYDPLLMTTSLTDGDTVMLLTFTVDAAAITGATDIAVDSSAIPLGYSDDLSATSLTHPQTTNGELEIDADAPTVTAASILSDNANNTTLAKAGDEITLSFTTSETPGATPVVSIVEGGAAAVSLSGSGTTYTATKLVGTGGDGVVSFSITIQDVYGNSSTQTLTTDASQVTVDTELPTITCPSTINQNVDANLCSAVVSFSTPTGADNLAGHSVAQTAGLTSGSVFPVGTSTVTFEVTDAAGNVADCSFDINVIDNVAPTVLTADTTLALDILGAASLVAADIDAGSADDCGIQSIVLDITSFDCNDVGSPVTVTLTVTDIHGNVGTETAVVTVVADPVISLAGASVSELGDTIPGVVYELSGDDGPVSQTGTSFDFLAAPCISTNEIGANKDDDAATNNGVDVQDAVSIVRHMLLIQSLNGPYKRIAADVNNSGTINILDVLYVLRKVNGAKQFFINPETGLEDAIWTFIPDDYTFADPTHPFGFPNRRLYVDPAPATGQDFIGVKLGDVNNSWNPNQLRTAAPKDSMHFVLDDVAAQPGELITIPVSVRDFKALSGYQFTLNWDPSVLSLQGVHDKALMSLFNTEESELGTMTAAWVDMNGQSVTLDDGTVAFEMVFEVVGNWESQTELTLSSHKTVSKALSGTGEVLGIGTDAHHIQVGTTTSVDPFELAGYKLQQNMPNPFTESTDLVFSLGQAEEVNLTIYNLKGQVVRQFAGKYAAGEHALNWNGQSDAGKEVSEGLYLVRLQAGGYVASLRIKKMN